MSNKITINLHEKVVKAFYPIFKTTAEEILMDTGRAGGKSFAIPQKLVVDKLQNPFGCILAFRKQQNTLKGSCYSAIRDTLIEFGVDHLFHFVPSALVIYDKRSNPDRIWGGAGFYFYGFDNEEKIRSTKFTNGAFPFRYWFEEWQENNRFDKLEEAEDLLSTFRRVKFRRKDIYHQFLWSYNPKRSPNEPINIWTQKKKEEWGNDKRFLRHYTTYEEVLDPITGESLISEQELRKILNTKERDPELYKWRYLGIPTGSEDQIYPNTHLFKKINGLHDLPEGEKLYAFQLVVDIGYSYSCVSFMAMGLTNKGNVVMLDTWYYSPTNTIRSKYPTPLLDKMVISESIKDQLSPSDIVGRIDLFIDKIEAQFGIECDNIVIDNAASGTIAEYRKQGNRVELIMPTKKKSAIINDKEDLITLSKTMIAQVDIYYIGDNGNDIVLYELEKYSRDHKGNIIKEDDHSVDCFQYFALMIWEPEDESIRYGGDY